MVMKREFEECEHTLREAGGAVFHIMPIRKSVPDAVEKFKLLMIDVREVRIRR